MAPRARGRGRGDSNDPAANDPAAAAPAAPARGRGRGGSNDPAAPVAQAAPARGRGRGGSHDPAAPVAQAAARGRGRGGSNAPDAPVAPAAPADPADPTAPAVPVVRVASPPSPPDRGRVIARSDPVPIIIDSEKYYNADDLAGKRKGRKRTSVIWKHGFEMVNAKTRAKHYYCRLCLDDGKDPTYKPLVLDGNSSALNHYRSMHEEKPAISTVERGSSAVASAVASAAASPGPVELVFQSTMEKFKLLLIQWIVFCHIAFFQVENGYFRSLISFLNSALAKFIPSRNTLRDWVLTEYNARKGDMRRQLRKSRSNIHLSFDLWTSPNFYTIISIVAHFIDANGCRQTKLLAIRS